MNKNRSPHFKESDKRQPVMLVGKSPDLQIIQNETPTPNVLVKSFSELLHACVNNIYIYVKRKEYAIYASVALYFFSPPSETFTADN